MTQRIRQALPDAIGLAGIASATCGGWQLFGQAWAMLGLGVFLVAVSIAAALRKA